MSLKVTPVDRPSAPNSLGGSRIRELAAESPRENAIRELIKQNNSPKDRAIEALMGSSAPVQPSPTPSEPVAQAPVEAVVESVTPAAELAPAPAAPVAEPAKSPIDDKMAARYAALVQREKALRAREQKLREQEESNAPRRDDKPSLDVNKFVDKDSLKRDPFRVLNELGLGYEELTQLALNQPSPETLAQQNKVSALESKIAELEGKLGNTLKSFEEQQSTQRQQAVNQISRDVQDMVRGSNEFETIKAANAHGAVVKLIERTFDEQGIMLDIEEAAREVEKTLFDKYSKIAQINKIKSQFMQAKTEAAPASNALKPENNQKPAATSNVKTLTNATIPSRKMSARERAIKAFHGESV